MKKAFNYLLSQPALVFLLAALIWSGVMFFINTPLKIQWKDIFVEANGMVFDLLVFGALLAWYDGKRQKNQRIEQDQNLIEDLRGWKNEEGVLRTVGAIRRLNREGIKDIDLFGCFLKKALLVSVELEGSNLQEANLQGAALNWTSLKKSLLDGANLHGADLRWGDIQFASLIEADFRGANLIGVTVGLDWFAKLEGWKVIGKEEILEKYEIDEDGVLQLR